MANLKYLIWALLAGTFIPLIGILNSRVGRALGEPFYSTVIVFMVAIILAIFVSIIFGKSPPLIHELNTVRLIDYGGGFIVAFYVISATVLAPRIGVANFIVMAVTGQILFSMLIDHLGLFGAPVKRINLIQFFGAILLLVGLVTTQLAGDRVN